MGRYSLNTVKLDIGAYRHYVRGIPKIGKTTFFRDLVIALYGDPRFGMLLSIGNEVGYKALANLYAFDHPEWKDFVATVDDLTDNRSDNEFRILGIDTVDELIDLAEQRVLEIHRREKDSPATSINAALGGFGAGKKKARALVDEQIGRLERAGYGMVYIGHTKIKDVTDPMTDQVYQKITGSMEFAYDAIFADRADFMPMLAEEITVKDERKTGGERVIYFRGNNFLDAGSRISGDFLPEKIALNAQVYIDAVHTALEKTAGITSSDAVSRRKQEETERIRQGTEASEKARAERQGEGLSLEELKEKVLAFGKSLSEEARAIKKEELKHAGLPTAFKNVDDLDTLRKIYGILNRDS